MAPHIQPALEQQHRGLWTQTATIDWCESNYELSYFIAEFWNTLSNLAFILPQMVQYFALEKHKSVELAFRRAFMSLALVGIGSFCFHMTLARPMQMFDETSMILVSLHGFYLLYIIKKPDVNRKLLLALLICYGLIFLSLYVFLVEWPIFHHSAFLVLVYASATIGYQLKQSHGPHYKFWTVLMLQHLAFVFWLIDKHYCEVLTQFREHHIPAALRPAFQFHAIWHLLMGLSTHIFICGLIRLRAWTKYREEFVITYKWFGLWITLEKVSGKNSPLASMDRKDNLKKLSENEHVKHVKYRNHHAQQAQENDNIRDDIGQFDMNSNHLQQMNNNRHEFSARLDSKNL